MWFCNECTHATISCFNAAEHMDETDHDMFWDPKSVMV